MISTILHTARNDRAMRPLECQHAIVRDSRMDPRIHRRDRKTVRCQACGQTWRDYDAWLWETTTAKQDAIA